MPIVPPWPDNLLVQLRAVLEELRRRAAADPQNPAIPPIASDVEAAIVKLTALACSTTQT